MTKQQSKRGGVRAWALQFKHSLGWTTFEIEFSRIILLDKKVYWEERCPKFSYKIIPVLITPIIKKARAKAQIKRK